MSHNVEGGGPPADPHRNHRPEAAVYTRIQSEDDFQRLRSAFRRFAFPVTVAFLSWYLLYVVLSGWARDFMGQQVVGNINVAFVFGLLQFVSTFLITWLYERHMNRHVDPLADQIVRDHDELADREGRA